MSAARPSPVGAFTAVAAATALGWAALVATGATGLEAICGGSGFGLATGTALMWGLMAATMMLPCVVHDICDAARDGWRPAAEYAVRCIAPPMLLAMAAGALLGPVAIGTPLLLSVAGVALLAECSLPATRLGSAVAMICLQLVGGAMDLGWMALVAIWMLALALAPGRRLVTAAAGVALLGAAVFGSL